MNTRLFRLVSAILAVVLFGNVISFTTKNNRYSESYPAVVCPPNLSGQSSFIALASPKTQVRTTGTSTMALKNSRTRRLAGTSQATVIDAQAVTPISWQVRTGVWAGGITCLAPITSQWFVGATADVTSKGTLSIVNSGLGKALVGVTVYTENGVQAEQAFPVKANSFITLALSSLSPGSRSIAIHVAPQSGRVNAFVTDERGRGLHALGGDAVNSTDSPSKLLVIPAVPHQVVKKKSQSHTLRVLIPGEVGAAINVVISSTDGTFSPAGIDGRQIPAGKVVDIPLNLVMPAGKFAVKITSERALVASVFTVSTSSNKTDFLWSTAAPAVAKGSFAITGLAPSLVFTGEDISVDLELITIKGKKEKITVRGSGITTYHLSDRIRAFTITKTTAKTYGAALLTSKSGSGYVPLVTGSVLTRTSIPRSNIRVLIP